MSNSKALLITVSGPDNPGITSALTKKIAEHECTIIDLGQAVTQGLLSLSIVINGISDYDEVTKELLFESTKMGLNMVYKEIEKKMADNGQAAELFILNCVSTSQITAHFINDITTTLAKNNVNIRRIDKVSPNAFKSLEITTSIPESLNSELLKKELLKISNEHKIDVAFLKDNVFRRSKRLIVFDMDSTLIQTEVIDEMADACGVGSEIREITESAMNGEIDFDQSLIKRVSKLKGLSTDKMEEILNGLPLTPGVEDFVKTVKSLGYKVAVISGGFSFFANALKEKLNLDYAFANELEIINDELTGNVTGTIVNASQKALLLNLISQQENISLEQTVAIGDGANDLPMLATAGLGIAFHAKDIVKKEASQHMSHGPMTSILYFLGIPGTQ